jgi:hypothetical protein
MLKESLFEMAMRMFEKVKEHENPLVSESHFVAVSGKKQKEYTIKITPVLTKIWRV